MPLWRPLPKPYRGDTVVIIAPLKTWARFQIVSYVLGHHYIFLIVDFIYYNLSVIKFYQLYTLCDSLFLDSSWRFIFSWIFKSASFYTAVVRNNLLCGNWISIPVLNSNNIILLVIRSVTDVLRARSRFVNFVGMRRQAELPSRHPLTHFTNLLWNRSTSITDHITKLSRR